MLCRVVNHVKMNSMQHCASLIEVESATQITLEAVAAITLERVAYRLEDHDLLVGFADKRTLMATSSLRNIPKYTCRTSTLSQLVARVRAYAGRHRYLIAATLRLVHHIESSQPRACRPRDQTLRSSCPHAQAESGLPLRTPRAEQHCSSRRFTHKLQLFQGDCAAFPKLLQNKRERWHNWWHQGNKGFGWSLEGGVLSS